MTNRVKEDKSLLERSFVIGIYAFVAIFALLCIIPFWLVVINSFATESSIKLNGMMLFPKEFTLYSYQFTLAGKQIMSSYLVTVIVTVAGTCLAILITSMYAYVLAHPKVKYRKILSFMTYFTMVFGAGLVGFYILVANTLGLKDTLWALILPYLLNPFFAFIMVSFFRTLPYEINEAATIDGANDLSIFFRIIIPISKPVIATVSLFYALQYWNDFYLALLFIDDYKLHPLQIMIRQIISNVNISAYVGGSNTNYSQAVPTYGVQLATVCLTIGPIIFLYPFIQKFFVKGITIGALKG
ncbi:carbohydrate ABC transporter permease [Cohnella lupini]|uniref:Multiple sugar transport system permease protein/putative aldouronate transport system permease protein n=1 Tax=Cohnella lupini TaxID=1294267 RepID=A0A3D9ISU0_9BACL|nr:carbohydrate ABC transporter permease [Cohnella lupini]RED64832.1 multiple sugar transport system permease protein/putative aldouronate transport system permease protein [Cohnella lupini]